MYLYLIFILLLAGSFLEIFDSKRQGTAQIIYYLTLSILFLLSFLRWERGTDWSGYYDYFSNISELLYPLPVQQLHCSIIYFSCYTIFFYIESYPVFIHISRIKSALLFFCHKRRDILRTTIYSPGNSDVFHQVCNRKKNIYVPFCCYYSLHDPSYSVTISTGVFHLR